MKFSCPPTYWILCAIMITLTGCPVLTESQIKETNRFATVTEGYSGLPGTALEHLIVHEKNIRLLEITNLKLPEAQKEQEGQLKAQQELEDARAQATERVVTRYHAAQDFAAMFKKDQARLEESLKFLDTYTKGLKALISTENIDDLDKAGELLGKNLDRATEQLQALGVKVKDGTDLGMIGSATAGAVRAIGGFILSYHQARYVKEFTTAYHPHIESATQAIIIIMNTLASRTATNEKKFDSYLGTQFQTFHHIDTSTALTISQETQRIHDLEASAKAAITASDALVDAHAAIREELKTRRTLTNAIENISVLAEHIKAGLALKKKLEKSS